MPVSGNPPDRTASARSSAAREPCRGALLAAGRVALEVCRRLLTGLVPGEAAEARASLAPGIDSAHVDGEPMLQDHKG